MIYLIVLLWSAATFGWGFGCGMTAERRRWAALKNHLARTPESAPQLRFRNTMTGPQLRPAHRDSQGRD